MFWKGQPVVQFANLSSFAEQLLVHENAVVKIADDIPLNIAALVGCGVITGAGAVMNTAKVPAGATVAVFGCGGIGLSAVNGAAIAGADRIIAIDTISSKLDVAKQMGATDVINASNVDPVEAIKELTGGGVEYAFEAVGLKLTAEQSFQCLRSGGTATIIGMVPYGMKIELHGYDFLRERKIQGSSMGSNRFRVRHAEAAERLEAGHSEAGSPDQRQYRSRRYQRRLREAEGRPRVAAVDRFRRRKITARKRIRRRRDDAAAGVACRGQR